MLDRFIAEVLLVKISTPIVIFVDEVDSLLSLDFSVNDFFALIRACYNHRVDGKVHDPDAALERILYWTGGPPFLTQKVCQLVVQAAEAGRRSLGLNQVNQVVETQIIQHWESQDEPEHLRTIRDRLLRDEKLASCLLGAYQEIVKSGTWEKSRWLRVIKTALRERAMLKNVHSRLFQFF